MASIDLEAPPEQTPPRRLPSVANISRAGFALIMRIAGLVLFAVLVLVAGIGSSRYMISRGSMLNTNTYGPWVFFRAAGSPDADPYTRAHFARTGELRIAANSAGVFEARTDNTGAGLHSSCDYLVEGPSPGGLWWSISVFDRKGRIIPNEAGRYAFTRDTVAPNPDGSFIVSLGRDARPGNWLPTGGAGRLVLVFTLLDPAEGFSQEERADRQKFLPTIRREDCS